MFLALACAALYLSLSLLTHTPSFFQVTTLLLIFQEEGRKGCR